MSGFPSPTSKDTGFDLVVAGAGIMGMACALEEAQRGQRVVVVDPHTPGLKASWAAAGLLVTRGARVFHSPFREFYVRSIQAYPEWVAKLRALSGHDLPIHACPDYQFFSLTGEKESGNFARRLEQLHKEASIDFEVLNTAPAFLQPHVTLDDYRVIHFPHEAYIQNRDLLEVLRLACEKAGVVFHTGQPIRRLHRDGQASWTVSAGEKTLTGEKLLLAAGAWTNDLLALLDLPRLMVPVKGQMLRMPRFYRQEALVHFSEEIYLVPRGDSLVAGATTEAGVWEEDFTEQGREYLTSRLHAFLGKVDATTLETWTGIRPRTRDRLPLMGYLHPDKSLLICAGHYKCGISMAPLSAACISKLLHDEKPPLDLSAFNPRRKKALGASILAEPIGNAAGCIAGL